MDLIRLYKPLIFIGLPGVGKSTVGQRVSQRLHIPFYDLDCLIEKKYRLSIQELFQRNQESYFRVLETQCLKELCRRSKPVSYVLSTGGGTILSEQNRKILGELGQRIYLRSPVESILRRIEQGELERPLFYQKTISEIRFILNQREKYYMESDWIVEMDGKSIQKVSKDIAEFLKQSERGIRDGKRGFKEDS